MFSLLVSFQGWGQPGGPPLPVCTEQQNYPYNVTHSLDTLPCMANDTSTVFQVKVGPSNVGSTFSVVDPLGLATITNTSVTSAGEFVFTVNFNTKSGWRKLDIIPSALCHRAKTIDVPVLCNCEISAGSYKVLGHPATPSTVSHTTINANSYFFVIGDITIEAPTNYTFHSKTFSVLGRNNYNTSTPGGSITGPFISLASQATPGNYFKVGSNGNDANLFIGEPCFGMWGGINFSTSQNGGDYLFENTNIWHAKLGIDNTTGIVKDLYINNCKVLACLNGVNTPAEYLKAFYDNEVRSETMLKPFDYEWQAGNHNYDLEQVNGLFNKTFTRFGLYLSGQRNTPRMVGSNWKNNLFKECIIGQFFEGGLNSQFDSDSNSYDRNLFAGLYLYYAANGEVKKGNFVVSTQSDNAYQLVAEKAIRRKPDNYGLFVNKQDSAFVSVYNSTFEGLSGNSIGIYYANEIGKVVENVFYDKFKAAISFRSFLTGSEIKANHFSYNKICILADSGSNETFNLHCNTFNLYSGTAIKFGPGAQPRFGEICKSTLPCGNKFLEDGFIIDNHTGNPNIDYWRYSNEINNLSIQSFRNSGFLPTRMSGTNGIECDSALVIFTKVRPITPQVIEEAQIQTLEEAFYTVCDLTGRVIFERLQYPSQSDRLRPGIYFLKNGRDIFLLRK